MNNKIKALLVIGVLALVALTSSCQSDNKAPKGDQTAETYQGKPGTFTIRFSVPSGDPVKYNLRMTQDDREYSINRVTLYIFDHDKLALNPIVINTPDLQRDAQDPTTMSYTYTSTDNSIPIPQGLVDIYAVANEDVSISLVKGDLISKLQNLQAKNVQRSNESSKDVVNGNGSDGHTDKIPMVGIKKGVLLFKQNVVLPLERIVARIDIRNNVANNQLTINSVTLENANSKSILVDDHISNVANGSAKVGGVKPFLFDPSSAQTDHKKVFYLYEGNQGATADDATYVVIKATFRGDAKVYKIPFFDTAKNKGIDIVRNTLYRIVLGTDYSKTNRLTFQLEVANWDGPVNTVVNWAPISVSFRTQESPGFSYDAKKHELKAPKEVGARALFSISGQFYPISKFTAKVEDAASSWLTASEGGDKIEIKIQAPGYTPRLGIVTVKCDKDPQFEYKILVKQDN